MTLWLAGMETTADRLNSMLPLTAFKAATTTRTSTTTASADPDLALTIPSTGLGTYSFELFLSVTGALLGTGDIKIGFSYSGSQTQGTWIGMGTTTAATTEARFFGQSVTGNTQAYGVNGGNFSTVLVNGSITATSEGVLSLLWAQNTSSGTGTNVRLGSWMKMIRLDL